MPTTIAHNLLSMDQFAEQTPAITRRMLSALAAKQYGWLQRQVRCESGAACAWWIRPRVAVCGGRPQARQEALDVKSPGRPPQGSCCVLFYLSADTLRGAIQLTVEYDTTRHCMTTSVRENHTRPPCVQRLQSWKAQDVYRR